MQRGAGMYKLLSTLLIAAVPLAAEIVTQEEQFSIFGDNLTFDLTIDGGKIQVLPSRSETECRVSMQYPKEKCRVDVRYNEKRGRIAVLIDFKKWNMEEEEAPTAIVELPSGPEISFSAHIKAGETQFVLGGLKIADFQLRHWAGETLVDFSEPNRTIMRFFDVNVKVGELTLHNVGNARYEEGEINSGIGELFVDFKGESVERCVTRIDLNIGETTIVLPESVGIKIRVSKFISEMLVPDWLIKRGEYYYSEDYEESKRQHYLLLSNGIGTINILRE